MSIDNRRGRASARRPRRKRGHTVGLDLPPASADALDGAVYDSQAHLASASGPRLVAEPTQPSSAHEPPLPDDVPVTELLRRAADGDASAYERVVEWAYVELERLARLRLRPGAGKGPWTLEPAALVNETFVKLLQSRDHFENRRHLLGFASTVMLRVLVDYQRQRGASKRGGGNLRVTLSEVEGVDSNGVEALDLERSLERLHHLDARKAEIAKLRLLWGYEMAEIAALVEVSIATVERDWRFSRAWLAEALDGRRS
jgi:RNA polymerase sigma factor (TIGR02999 family)